ncbi:MAG: hypothetical protein ACUVQS_02560 [Candidatus Bipolaricaulaceae bacterium]
MNAKPCVVFLWHMHQPWYLLPDGKSAELPWVRLRAAKDYYDMARHLQSTSFPCTVNFTPALTEQLRLLSAGEICDPYTPDGPVQALEEVRAGFIPMPLSRRGLPTPSSLSSPEEIWSWFYLAWTSQTVLEEDHDFAGILSASPTRRLELLQGIHRELLAEVLPLYRKLTLSDQIELFTTPFYHPILPLLLGTTVAKRARPEDEIPVFSAPGDAKAQAEKALSHHVQIFGERPRGVWPAEGAVSPEALELLASLGVRWVATDGEILARTLGRPPEPAELYRPWRLRFGAHEIIVVFRDTFLSNLLSFEYGKWPWKLAVQDFLSKLAAAVSGWRASAPPLIVIAMDGENAWDHYERNGRPFLLELYRAIQAEFTPTTIGSYIQRYGVAGDLPTIWSGSWIDGDFRTWIGEPLQNRAWQALAGVRAAVDSHPSQEVRGKALPSIYVAEGSDWFWWRSSRNFTPLAPHFSKLFRAHLEEAWRALGRTPPRELETL